MSKHTLTPKLVMGDIVCIGSDDEESIPYDEAVIHLEGDEDSEIRINCPGALRLAPLIVKAVNSHDALVQAVKDCLIVMAQADAGDTLAARMARDALTVAGESEEKPVLGFGLVQS